MAFTVDVALACRALNLSMRPATSSIFSCPVKKGWHCEQISTSITGLVEPTVKAAPQEQVTFAFAWYAGWIPDFIPLEISRHRRL